jgi:hypothetical protein
LGSTLLRAAVLDTETGELDVLFVEELVARTTAFVWGRLQRGKSVDMKHATAKSSRSPATVREERCRRAPP